MTDLVSSFRCDESADSAIEYAFIAAVVSIFLIASNNGLGSKIAIEFASAGLSNIGVLLAP
jgi:Flp pilus assembly pilin Flp